MSRHSEGRVPAGLFNPQLNFHHHDETSEVHWVFFCCDTAIGYWNCVCCCLVYFPTIVLCRHVFLLQCCFIRVGGDSHFYPNRSALFLIWVSSELWSTLFRPTPLIFPPLSLVSSLACVPYYLPLIIGWAYPPWQNDFKYIPALLSAHQDHRRVQGEFPVAISSSEE